MTSTYQVSGGEAISSDTDVTQHGTIGKYVYAVDDGPNSDFIKCVFQDKYDTNKTVPLLCQKPLGCCIEGCCPKDTLWMPALFVLLAFVILVFLVGCCTWIFSYQRSKNKQRKEEKEFYEMEKNYADNMSQMGGGYGQHQTTYGNYGGVMAVAESLLKHYNIMVPTLVTHSTIFYFKFLLKQLVTFDGFISYSILISDNLEYIVEKILIYQKCYKPFRNRVSVHIVWYEKSNVNLCKEKILFYMNKVNINTLCSTFDKTFLFNINEQLDIEKNEIYPINIMRNVARKGSLTTIQILSDIENIFSFNFSQIIQNNLYKWSKDKYDKSVFIYMRFETKKDSMIPRNLQQLKISFLENTTVPYHKYIFPQGHLITNFTKWYNDSIQSDTLKWRVIPYRHFSFEPQVILRSFDPYHYENVPTRIFDHQVLINELCHSGYIFKLLNQVFNIHQGIKKNESKSEILTKQIGMKNIKVFKINFNKYLKDKYATSNSSNYCPKF
ncbi:N-acetyllactosaminide beta-1,3-N-acetylglucosaminyltransferase [Strongyloides ratti]|uniref:N-acetyllactosaminide beta-1,3-N-acetylglucosaminyltransferase n=1 Tax=Strongyloides ratti TaxID=34506 RepID=A0A090L7X2_STRRB|nr:N-acetyllactosaminide beta-1,3-N-acetylglucosaminyltransferase [Strongyloides ratti]CEF63610.1 N-acetyllactosaminide beta-1,3-N-acetylglucosaminyltransferase [Strongyloides ratti]